MHIPGTVFQSMDDRELPCTHVMLKLTLDPAVAIYSNEHIPQSVSTELALELLNLRTLIQLEGVCSHVALPSFLDR